MHIVEAKGILSAQNGMNVYRGCTHGCIYCDSRSRCYQINHAFEDIEVKGNAPQLLEEALRRKRKRCMIGTGAMTDPYIPLEREVQNTRKCLELIDHYGFGLAIQTKSDLILRDLDLLISINQKAKCVVQITLTTYDDDLCKLIEPNVCTTKERLRVLEIMKENEIPTIVWLSPILPFINDTEENILAILEASRQAGVRGILCFSCGMTLREGNREYYYAQLDKHFPGLKQKYIQTYGNSYEVNSSRNRELMKLLHDFCCRYGMMHKVEEIFDYLHAFPEEDFEQLRLPL